MPTGKMLGKKPPKYNPKTLKLSKYLLAEAPPLPPAKVWREYKIPEDAWDMFANDRLGDCTCAAIAHMLMLTTAHTGKIVVPTDTDVIIAYIAVSGYDPATGANDNGAAITDVLNYWQTVGIAGHKILGWAQIDTGSIEKQKQAIYLFGGVDLGVNLPNSAFDQTDANKPWKPVEDDGGIAGGHSICNFGYGKKGTNCITWGQRQEMSWDWFAKYCDESYAVITEDWINQPSGLAPNFLSLGELQTDLAALRA